MQKFDFEDLIKEYSRELTVIFPAKKELHDNGDWVKGEPKEETIVGALIKHRESKIYRSEGTLTGNDCALYLTEKPPFSLEGAFIIDNNKKYSVESVLDNAEFTGVWSFNAKFISAFNEKDGEGK